MDFLNIVLKTRICNFFITTWITNPAINLHVYKFNYKCTYHEFRLGLIMIKPVGPKVGTQPCVNMAPFQPNFCLWSALGWDLWVVIYLRVVTSGPSFTTLPWALSLTLRHTDDHPLQCTVCSGSKPCGQALNDPTMYIDCSVGWLAHIQIGMLHVYRI